MKLIGYIIALIGLIGLGTATIKEIRDPVFKTLNLTSLPLSDDVLIIISVIVIIIGIFKVIDYKRYKKSSRGEIPIYKGNKIIGYRTH